MSRNHAASSGGAAPRTAGNEGGRPGLRTSTPARIASALGANRDPGPQRGLRGSPPQGRERRNGGGKGASPRRAANGRATGRDRPLKLPERFPASLEPRFGRPGRGRPGSGAKAGWDPGPRPTLEAPLLTSCCSE